jgi:hypothetical protein
VKTTRSQNLLAAALVSALALAAVRAADITPADSSAVVLTKEETKAIAEEGFIYGLPIVMNYGVMYEYSVDKNSQKNSPGKDKESNWLPAPNDLIYLVMRLYWPKTEAPSILPAGEGTWKPPGIVKAK